MTSPQWWIASPSPWGPPGGDPIQADVEVPEPKRHPGLVRPVPKPEEFKHCDTRPHWSQQSTCRSWCKLVYNGYPVAPDGRSFAARNPAGGVLLIPLHCLHPYEASEGTPRTKEVSDAEAPEWAKPVELLNPPPSATLSFPPTPGAPGPTQAEELARTRAVVPPGTGLPSLGLDVAAAVPAILSELGVSIKGGEIDLGAIVQVLVRGLGIADRIRATLAGVAPGVADKLGPSIEGLAPLLAGLPPELTAGLTPALRNLSQAYTTAAAQSSQLQLAQDQVEGEQDRAAQEGLTAKLWAAAGDAAEPLLRQAMAALQKVLGFVGDKVQDLGELLVKQIGAVYRDALEARAPVTTANVSGIAAEALKNALAAGLAAQTAALLLELLHPVKRLGLNQVVGFIADFAGFSKVAGSFTEPSLRHGLQIPAEHRAASVFRTALPGAGDAQEQAFQRHISLGDYAHILALHGFPSWWVKVLVDDTFVDPKPRELSQLLEHAEADPGWLAMKLREVGWDDGDVEKGVAALQLRSTQPGRSRLIAAAMRAYANGQIGLPALGRELDATALRPEHRAYWLRAARLERRADLMESLGSRVVKQYREDVTTRVSAEAQLLGLGFTPDEARARLLQADLDRQVVQLREEAQDVEAHVRQIRTTALTNLRTQFRAGLVSRGELVGWGEALGYTSSYLENVADLEELKGPPSKAELVPVMGLGAVAEAAAQAEALLRDEVRQGRVSPLAAAEILQTLGVDPERISGVFRVAEVLGLPSPAALGIPVPDGRGGRLGWEHVLGEVLGEIHRGRAGSRLLHEVSELLGIPSAHTASRDPWLDLLGRVLQER